MAIHTKSTTEAMMLTIQQQVTKWEINPKVPNN